MGIYGKIFKLMSVFCHQRPDRSFYFFHVQFLLCARCTGLVVGFFVSIIIHHFLLKSWPKMYSFFFLISVLLNGLSLFIETSNLERFILGILLGSSTGFLMSDHIKIIKKELKYA